jgi:hypothetical protein
MKPSDTGIESFRPSPEWFWNVPEWLWNVPQWFGNVPEWPGNVPEWFGKVPEMFRIESRCGDWRLDSRVAGKKVFHKISVSLTASNDSPIFVPFAFISTLDSH